MKKLNKDEQAKVESAKESINKLQEAQDLIYAYLVKELDSDNDWLYDYVFNASTIDDEYVLMVKDHLFE